MNDDERTPALTRGSLANGLHHFLIAWPNAQRAGTATTPVLEAGPFNEATEAIDSLGFYDLMLREHLDARHYEATEYRVATLQVGERLTPAPGQFFIVARTDYLEAPVAGGFSDYGEALWVYGVVIDHVAARLAYLEEDLFTGLLIDIEEYECGPEDLVWVRQVNARRP